VLVKGFVGARVTTDGRVDVVAVGDHGAVAVPVRGFLK
jgi:hypothetical protein